MRRALATAGALLGACGADPGAARAGVGVTIQGLSAAEVGAVQIALLKNGLQYDCVAVAQKCLASQVSGAEYVPLTLSDNRTHFAALFPADGAQVTGAGQTFTLPGIPVGKNYLVVAEVLSPDRAQLRASGCDLREELTKGTNRPLAVTAREISPVPTCDPRIEK